MVYRVLWTNVDSGGWFSDVDATDEAEAAWQVATHAPPGQDGTEPRLVSVTNLNPPSPAAAHEE